VKRYVLCCLVGALCLFFSVSSAQTADPAPPAPSGERMVSLDFDNVDLPVMVKFISELTGKNFVIDEQVRGKVTIFSPVKIPVSKAYDVFISVLEMKGFTVIQTGAVYQILPFAASPPNRSMHIYTIQNTVAEEVSQVLTSLVSRAAQPMRPKAGSSDEIAGPVQIITDKTTNQLLITASDDDYAIVEKTIKSLDKKRRQVYVEAVVMEVGEEKTRQIGTDLTAIFGMVPSPGSDLLLLGDLNGGLASGLGLLASSTALGINGISPRAINARSILKALQDSSDVNVLSTPQILTSDKQKAEISVAKNVPFPGAQSQNAQGTQTTIERKDVGVILRLTPTVMENSQVKLEIYQEISSVFSEGSKELGPTTSKRAANTSVIVKDGQTAVIGGLLSDEISMLERKVPLLGDIPILGWFFKFKQRKVEKRNLLIFVTPYVVGDDTTKGASDLYERKAKDFLETLRERKSRNFIDDNKIQENMLNGKPYRETILEEMINIPK